MRTCFVRTTTSVNYSVFKYASTLSRSSSLNHVGERRHPVAACIDDRLDIRVRRRLAVLQLGFLRHALQPGTHFLLVAVGVMTHRAIVLEHGFALLRRLAGGSSKTRPPIMRAAARQLVAMIPFCIPTSLQSPHMAIQIGDKAPEIKSGDFQLSKLKGKARGAVLLPQVGHAWMHERILRISVIFSSSDKHESLGASASRPIKPEARRSSLPSTDRCTPSPPTPTTPSPRPTACGRRRACMARNTWASSALPSWWAPTEKSPRSSRRSSPKVTPNSVLAALSGNEDA